MIRNNQFQMRVKRKTGGVQCYCIKKEIIWKFQVTAVNVLERVLDIQFEQTNKLVNKPIYQ